MWLCILMCNLVLLLFSFASLYISSIFILFYFLPSLTLLTPYFAAVPYTILVTGLLHLTASTSGLIFLAIKYRVSGYVTSYRLIGILHVALLGVAVPVHLVSILSSLHLRTLMDTTPLFQVTICYSVLFVNYYPYNML